MQEIYGLHAIPSSLGFAISKLPPFGRHRRRARRWRPEKQMAEPNLGNRVAGNIVFFWVAPVASFLFQCPQQTTKPTKKIMNKNHNAAATQRHQNLAFFFLCASHRSKAVERTFEEVRSQRREKFMHCFQQVQITQPSSEKTGGLGQGGWQCFFFCGGKFGDLQNDLNRMLCIYDTEIFLRFKRTFSDISSKTQANVTVFWFGDLSLTFICWLTCTPHTLEN